MAGQSFGQKFDKKYSDTFNVQKDVEVEINASNAEINVTTWSKNQVQVNAFIEIEGLDKKEAEKYFKNWNFEALGNKSKVKITAKGNNRFPFKNDFVFFNDQNFVMPDIDFENFDAIVLPEMNFDFDFDFKDLKVLEGLESLESLEVLKDFDSWVGKDGDYNFTYKDGDNKIEIKSKKDWEKFKKSKEYKKLKEKMKFDKEKMRKDLAKSREEIRKQIEENRMKIKIDKQKIRESLEKAKAELKKLKLNYSADQNSITIDGKKVKIKKRIEIKVPKKATFNLNTRHCKVKLPNTVAYGSVRYGAFDANALAGGDLKIYYSPVTIQDLNACNLFLNNVTDATIASVTNAKLSNSSSGVKINKVNQNVNITHKFGDLSIDEITSDYASFRLLLDYANAHLGLKNITAPLNFDIGKKSPLFPEKAALKMTLGDNKRKEINGNFLINSSDKNFVIKGKYSQLVLKN
ncbi:MAG: hypothetical protein CMB99_08540 [Flavobacteriaceae bacterium]|nr:hypothetical protein [Flavobacteriaceae bacterium]|tara:strand:- start:38554 stop:39939 length:1386 start_codon:yes stop_codon:yes gene_type:complete